MNCLAVRERLPEHALDVLPGAEAASVDRHLEWCAACRKESRELLGAAATMAYSVAPVEPPPSLEGTVVDAVHRAAGRRAAAAPRRSRVAAAGALAAMLALSGLGWGAVMAGRAERFEAQAAAARQRQEEAIGRFRQVFNLPEVDPEAIVEIADLMSPRQRGGAGDALVLLSPTGDDLVLVVLRELDLRDQQLPLEVRLVSDRAGEHIVGPIRALDSGGGGGVSRWFVEDLQAFDAVVVRDAAGRVLLNGSLGVYEPGA